MELPSKARVSLKGTFAEAMPTCREDGPEVKVIEVKVKTGG